MLPEHVSNIIINTGNIINSKELKKKAMQSPSEEICDSTKGTFCAWLKSSDLNAVSSSIFCEISHHEICSSISNSEKSDRADLKISVKVFLETFSCEALQEAISQAMKVLDIHIIDSLILSLPASPNDEKFDLNKVKPLWITLENLLNEERIVTIGISDLDTTELKELYDWTQVKPSVNQVNLESCCVMPAEMIAFAKEKDIQLLTHNDPKVILTNEMLQKILESGVEETKRWKMNWIVRYSVVVKCRGIIQNKGYLLSANKQ